LIAYIFGNTRVFAKNTSGGLIKEHHINHGKIDLQPTREGKELMQKMALCNAVISQVRNLNSSF
jgi:hypothetical protein